METLSKWRNAYEWFGSMVENDRPLRPRAPRLTRGAPTGGRQGGLDPAEPQRAPRGCPGPATRTCDAQLRQESCAQRSACAIPPRARGAGPRAPLTAAAAAQARKGETVAVKIDAVNDQQEGCPLPPPFIRGHIYGGWRRVTTGY